MTDQEINKAIAESIGWKWVNLQEQIGLRGVLRGYPPNVECVGVNQEYVTDYCNDLNAMNEAEKILTEEQFYEYGANLDKITLPKNKMEMCYVHCPEAGMYRELICATAMQRAEAFLKTLNLWTE